jgi:hypothetical protein
VSGFAREQDAPDPIAARHARVRVKELGLIGLS